MGLINSFTDSPRTTHYCNRIPLPSRIPRNLSPFFVFDTRGLMGEGIARGGLVGAET